MAGHVLCGECSGYTVGASSSPGASTSVKIMDRLACLMEREQYEAMVRCSMSALGVLFDSIDMCTMLDE